ncbi:MAG: hypothetical protein KAH32_06560 [Chlamydiia bacterium]|nr:hypothetical protein [Chlamydiia bacterium]
MKFNNYIIEKSEYIIYIDMDGVITDFVEHAEQTFGVRFNTLLDDDNMFWSLIRKEGEKYWSEMPMMSDAKKLMNYIKDENISILSSAGSSKNATKDTINGKKKWMKKNYPKVNVIIEYHKYKYAHKKAILIDDLQKNISPWIKSGGIGILHTSANDTINKLKAYGV